MDIRISHKPPRRRRGDSQSQKPENRRILITAGPTWVPIDSVRVISNIATGETGILLAKELKKAGFEVTLVLGRGEACFNSAFTRKRRLKLIRFRFYDELRALLRKELQRREYHLIIHSAAVSDFRPGRRIKGKLSSDKSYRLELRPVPKIISEIKSYCPLAKLVMFKLETGITDKELIRRARLALTKNQADLIVANRIKPHYRAYIADNDRIYARCDSKYELSRRLTGIIIELMRREFTRIKKLSANFR